MLVKSFSGELLLAVLRRVTLIVLLLPVAALSAAAPAPPHTFTDQFGRTMLGDIVEVTGPQVKIRRNDGETVMVELAKLVEADAAYVTRWEREHRAFRLRIDASSFHHAVGSNQSRDAGRVIQNMEMGYEIKITNESPVPAAELRFEYNVFVLTRSTVPGGPNSYGMSTTRITSTPGRIRAKGTIDQMGLKQTATVRTSPLAYTATESAPSAELQGVWVRVYFEDRVVAEFLSSEKLRGEGWQEITPVPARGFPLRGFSSGPPS